LYQECAFLTAPSGEDLEQGTSSPLSEQALRQCMRVYGLLGMRVNAHHVYKRYVKLLRHKWSEWRPDPQTNQTFEAVTGLSAEDA